MVGDGISFSTTVLVPPTRTVRKQGEIVYPQKPSVPKDVTKANGPAAEESTQVTKLDSQDLRNGIEELNHYMKAFNVKVAFLVDKPTGRTVIRIRNSETEEVIREFPPEEFLKLASKLSELMGILVDEKI